MDACRGRQRFPLSESFGSRRLEGRQWVLGTATYFVDSVSDQTFDLISINSSITVSDLRARHLQRHGEFFDWYSRPSHSSSCSTLFSIFWTLKTACKEHFAEDVAENDIPSALEREVDTTLDELIFACFHGGVEGREIR